MPRRLALICLALTIAAGIARAQAPFGRELIPSRRALSRINLDMQWNGVVPLSGAEKLIEMSIDAGMLFAQTNHASFHAFDAETGRYLWGAHLGQVTPHAQPASVNSTSVFVTSGNSLFALDRRTGRQVWTRGLSDTPSSATNADDDRVVVGLESGKLATFDAKTGAEKWNIQTNEKVTSRPLLAGRVVAFGSEDRKLYLSKIERPHLHWRFATGGPIDAPLGFHGVRTLLVPSTDKNVYAVDLFTGELKWTFGSGAAVKQEPIVADDDVFIVNVAGFLTAIDVNTGEARWTISTLGGRILSVSQTKIYLESHDADLFVVDRQTGKTIYDPATTFSRAGINLRGYTLGPTNRLDDRLYFATSTGLVLCLREVAQVTPRMIRDPKAKPFGYIPPEGYPDTSITPTAPAAPVEGAEAAPK